MAMSALAIGDHVFLDEDFPDVVVVTADALGFGFDWADNAGAGGREPFVCRDGKSYWRLVAKAVVA